MENPVYVYGIKKIFLVIECLDPNQDDYGKTMIHLICGPMGAGKTTITSTFQVSKIGKPLWSVGKLCDAGFKVEFDKTAATVTTVATGKKVGRFPRSQDFISASSNCATRRPQHLFIDKLE